MTEAPTTIEPVADPAAPAADPAAPVEPVQPTAVEPLSFDQLKMPEGFTVSEDLSKSFVDLMNNTELSPTERAQSLVDLQAQAATQLAEANTAAWNKVQDDWKAEVKADPVIGGAKLEGTLTSIGKLVTEYGTPELRQTFDLTGAGNNIHVIRFLDKIASQLTEGGFVSGSPPQSGDKSAASIMFPSMKG